MKICPLISVVLSKKCGCIHQQDAWNDAKLAHENVIDDACLFWHSTSNPGECEQANDVGYCMLSHLHEKN